MSGQSSGLTEDKDVLSLNDTDFHEVLEQLTDYKKPERDKCPLVRKLNVDAIKDESSLEARYALLDGIVSSGQTTNNNNGRRKTKGGKQHNMRSSKQERGSSQSLQDLTESKPSKGKKGSRANSFCRESTRSQEPSFSSSWSPKNLTSSYSCHANHVSSSSSPKFNPSSCSNNYNKNCDSESFTPHRSSSNPSHSNNMMTCQDNNRSMDMKSQEGDSFELFDLGKRAQLVNYRSHPVDSFINLSDLTERPNTSDPPLRDRQLDIFSGLDHKDRSSSTNETASTLQNNSSTRATSSFKSNAVKKKKKEEPKLLAEQIEGHIGDRDVDYLTEYIVGMDSKAALKRDRKSKTDSGKGSKNPRKPRSSSAENTKQGRPRSPSPLPSPSGHTTASMSSYDADELTLRDEFSDGDAEKGYHTDQDSGFQVIRTKKRYNRHKSRPSQAVQNKRSSSPVTSSSLSAASFSLVSGTSAAASDSTAMTSRGYESEKEFYPEEDFRLSQVNKRKTASSMPHSERNSPENSDLDSSLSLPFVHRTIVPRDTNTRPSYAATVASSSTDPVMMTNAVKEPVAAEVNSRAKSVETTSLPTCKVPVVQVDKKPFNSDRQTLKKQNSVPGNSLKSIVKTKGLNRSLDCEQPPPPFSLESLPPVIMCNDDVPSTQETTSTVTFGFFDDLSTQIPSSTSPHNTSVAESTLLCPAAYEQKKVSETKQGSQESLEQQTKLVSEDDIITSQESSEINEKEESPEPHDVPVIVPPVIVEVNKKPRRRIDKFGGDVNSYNYYEVVAYIRKAWESVIPVDGALDMKTLTSGSKELI